LKRVEFVVACDVETKFLQAAEQFAAQKGANASQVKFLSARLSGTAEWYRKKFAVDVTQVAGGGAAGGLAGGLFALGARLEPGFALVADEIGLYETLPEADVVITGEGRLDASSFSGKVVGEVITLARKHDKRVVAICGEAESGARLHAHRLGVTVVSLRDDFGDDAVSFTTRCVQTAAERVLRAQ
jgi:glycerate kinase